jgi:hypothetical protein
VNVEYESHGTSEQVIVRNDGYATANNVKLTVVGDYNPIVNSELEEFFPVKKLLPDQEIRLIAATSMPRPSSFEVEITWEDLGEGIRGDQRTIYL